MMKFFLASSIVIFLLSTGGLYGQNIELYGFTGYQLGGKTRLYEGDFRIDNAQNYGGKIAVGLFSGSYAEISYMRTDTEGRFFPFDGQVSESVPFSTNYIQLAALRQLDLDRVSPFATLGFGFTVWSPKNSSLEGKTQFSTTVGGGLKIWLSDLIGIRMQATLLLPMIYNGYGFGCGIGTGGINCSSNVYTRVTPVQGEFSGGIVFRFSL